MRIKTYKEYLEKYFPNLKTTNSENDLMKINLARKALEKSEEN